VKDVPYAGVTTQVKRSPWCWLACHQRLPKVGDRTKGYLKSETATTYLQNPVNELTKVDNTTYEYDAAGNLTRDGTHSYYWDYENRLTKVKLVSDGSGVAEYTYDALGRRAEKIDHTGQSASTTRWYLDGWSVVGERDGDDTLQATFINGARLDEHILMNRNSTRPLVYGEPHHRERCPAHRRSAPHSASSADRPGVGGALGPDVHGPGMARRWALNPMPPTSMSSTPRGRPCTSHTASRCSACHLPKGPGGTHPTRGLFLKP
jgi:YD repeat-containing protein